MTTYHQQGIGIIARSTGSRSALSCLPLVLFIVALLLPTLSHATETVCARVKIEIKQELTLERQAFDAQMKINNTTADSVIQNVSVEVKVFDENGSPIAVSSDPNNTDAKFYVRVSGKQGIADISGTGVVNPQTAATIDWLIIPVPGSAGNNPSGKKYLVGATLKYTFGGEDTSLEVTPDVITVKPLPLLTLDYFLTQDVWADDALTPEIEPTEPFTLGVRVKNDGFATAKSLKIDSAQPKIIENNQGLVINFLITGSYVDDQPAQNTLLIDFGDIAPDTSKMGRWVMETSLAGKFTEFTAKFSHADELGGTLTSTLKATNPHFLLHDVWVDLPGRDAVRDFLAQDGTAVKVYESDGTDTEVTNRSAGAILATGTAAGGQAVYQLDIPVTDGFVYVKLPDPFNGKKVISHMLRSDGKVVSPANAWLSKTRNEASKQWQYWFNLFDVNTPGHYDTEFQTPQVVAVAPVLQAIPDHQVQETKQVSFLVEASSPQGKQVTLNAAPLPQGATFAMLPSDPAAPGVASAAFDWKPKKGQAGTYPVTYTASDGSLSGTVTANIKVDAFTPPHGPETPAIVQPLSGAEVAKLKPTLAVQASTNPDDLTTQIQFEIYKDEGMADLLATVQVDKALPAPGNGAGTVPQPTEWAVPTELDDNTPYWWRARAYDGVTYSPWANARFFANLYNDPPNNFNLTSPAPGTEVDSLTPTLAWDNSTDKDMDTVTYDLAIYNDAGLANKATQAIGLAAGENGSSHWLDDQPLTNHGTYYWQVVAKDSLGAQTVTIARPFTVNTGNSAPTDPVIVNPVIGGQSADLNASLKIQDSEDADGDDLTYVFEIDTANTFDSPGKRQSLPIKAGSGGTNWATGDLAENQHYWWRVKANDGRADSAWAVGDFLVNVKNDPPGNPTVKNPGSGSWSATLTPTLEANPATDPEGEAVRYQFEVYQGSGLKQKVSEGISANTTLAVPSALADKTTYSWRVRALDPEDAASDWSPTALLFVSTGPYQAPAIAVTTPATPIVPTISLRDTNPAQIINVRKQVTINWEGVDPNIEPTVALYYDSNQSGYSGTLIAGGLSQAAGQQTGSYVWDVSDLAPGDYYIYATITDPAGIGKAYAPGAVVIQNLPQAGKIVVTAAANLRTTELGGTAKFTVHLGTAPKTAVTVPLSVTDSRQGAVSPAQLAFTPDNWSQDQTVTLTGKDNCAPGSNLSYMVQIGRVVSLDPDYIGLLGTPVVLNNTDDSDLAGSTNDPNQHICAMTIVKETKLNANLWEYALAAKMTNTALPLGGVTAKLTQLPTTMQVIEDTLGFGAASQGETITSTDTVTVTVQSPTRVTAATFKKGTGFKWSVTLQP